MTALRPRILLTGKDGQIGWELQRTLAPLGELVALNRQELDLANPDQLRERIRAIKPNLIINAAAYTAVDQAEADMDTARRVNGVAPGILAEEAKRMGAFLVHYSTDYVFDGNKDTPYIEEDEPNPLNRYGQTKLEGERAIQAVGAPYMIFRTSWVYGLRGKNFLLTILRLAATKDELKVVDDQIGAPTWSRMVAEATAQVLAQGGCDPEEKSGIYHLTAGGQTSWCGFAKAIVDLAPNSQRSCLVRPIPTRDYPTPARRPKNSLLSNQKFAQTFSLKLPSWHTQLELAMHDLGQNRV